MVKPLERYSRVARRYVDPQPPAVPLRMQNFTRIAVNGFGDPLNAYAHTMAWFGDHLYVGTTRANLCLLKARVPLRLPVWPVNCPEEVFDIDLRAHIWRYHIESGTWENVHVSPWVSGRGGRQVPREIGYRGMISYQGPSDSAPCLYVANWANRAGGQVAQVFRSTDGHEFVPVSQPGLADATITTLRSLVPFRGRLFTSPVGSAGVAQNMPSSPVVLVATDPVKNDWRVACAPGFGDENNKTIFEMAVFNGWLYAGTLNPVRGFQIWRTDAAGDPPYKWMPVVIDGAERGNLNECVVSMCVFKDALYVGTGIQNGGHDRTYNVGPAAAEIIRVHPDGSWDLVVGMQRPTREGRKAPLSGLGPGFDNFFNGYIWRIREHAGCLYAGTCDWSTLLPFTVPGPNGGSARQVPLEAADLATVFDRLIQWVDPANIVKFEGGFDLWSSEDGVRWTPVTTNGFGNPYNYGARTMVSTPHGFFVGTANPFGPEIATKTPAGWGYMPNPEGGAEVWLGRSA
jgi:hypothetical protein